MTHHELTKMVESLEHKIAAADANARLKLQPEFKRALERLTVEGGAVPARLRQLDAELVAEAVEARFDNMPV